jgi:hypothetical protein
MFCQRHFQQRKDLKMCAIFIQSNIYRVEAFKLNLHVRFSQRVRASPKRWPPRSAPKRLHEPLVSVGSAQLWKLEREKAGKKHLLWPEALAAEQCGLCQRRNRVTVALALPAAYLTARLRGWRIPPPIHSKAPRFLFYTIARSRFPNVCHIRAFVAQ